MIVGSCGLNARQPEPGEIKVFSNPLRWFSVTQAVLAPRAGCGSRGSAALRSRARRLIILPRPEVGAGDSM